MTTTMINAQDIYSVCVLHLSVLQFCDIFTDILCSWVIIIIIIIIITLIITSVKNHLYHRYSDSSCANL